MLCVQSSNLRNSTISGIGLAAFIMAALLIPIDIADSTMLSREEIECGRLGAYRTFENPIEQLWIKDIAVTERDGDNVYTSAYTFFGIRISQVETNCRLGSIQRL